MYGGDNFHPDIDKEIILMRLYRIFRLDEEDYITSVKLHYIYDHIRQEAGDEVFVVITERLRDYKFREKKKRLNGFYNTLQGSSLSLRAAPPEAQVPGGTSRYVPGWKCG